ncbi:MAG: 50S ribosomal protein L24 [Patescibacteria group bacterium]
MKLRRGDNVMILAGKDGGKTGIIERVAPKEGRVVVKGLNMAKKHVKPSRKNPQGGILDINLPLQISNVGLVCPSCGKTTRVGYAIKDKVKSRICRKCGQSVEAVTK